MDLKNQILVALGLDKTEAVEETTLSFQAKLVDGTIIVSEDDALVEGSLVNVLTEDGTTMALPVGEYRTEDGLGFIIETEGIVSSLLTEEAPAVTAKSKLTASVELSLELAAGNVIVNGAGVALNPVVPKTSIVAVAF